MRPKRKNFPECPRVVVVMVVEGDSATPEDGGITEAEGREKVHLQRASGRHIHQELA